MPLTKFKNAKQFFVELRYTSGNFTTYGNHTPKAIGNAATCQFQFVMPDDFYSLTSAEVIGIADATETIQFDISTDMASAGQAYNVRTDSIVDQTKGTTANQIWRSDISTGLDGVLAGDLVGITFTSNTDFLYISGLVVKYVPTGL